jgi:hypothetical protein
MRIIGSSLSSEMKFKQSEETKGLKFHNVFFGQMGQTYCLFGIIAIEFWVKKYDFKKSTVLKL